MKWISINDELPAHGTNVLATYKNLCGKQRTIVAHYLERWKEESFDDDNNDEYSDESDMYYLREGWYENLDNWDYSSVAVHEGVITHWMPLPNCPDEEALKQTE